MAYYECLSNNDYIINIGDNFTVKLTGSHNVTTSATVCYIYKGDKTTICLLGDTNLGTVGVSNWATAYSYAWNYTININNKEYTGTCKIPTLEQIYSKCAGYIRNFAYWNSTRYTDSSSWSVYDNGLVSYNGNHVTLGTLPFIEITL